MICLPYTNPDSFGCDNCFQTSVDIACLVSPQTSKTDVGRLTGKHQRSISPSAALLARHHGSGGDASFPSPSPVSPKSELGRLTAKHQFNVFPSTGLKARHDSIGSDASSLSSLMARFQYISHAWSRNMGFVCACTSSEQIENVLTSAQRASLEFQNKKRLDVIEVSLLSENHTSGVSSSEQTCFSRSSTLNDAFGAQASGITEDTQCSEPLFYSTKRWQDQPCEASLAEQTRKSRMLNIKSWEGKPSCEPPADTPGLSTIDSGAMLSAVTLETKNVKGFEIQPSQTIEAAQVRGMGPSLDCFPLQGKESGSYFLARVQDTELVIDEDQDHFRDFRQMSEAAQYAHVDTIITKEEGLVLYEDMVLGRSFEDMCAQMYYRGKMFGFVHLYNGQEAVSTGFIKSLKPGDYVCSTYRDHVHALSKGVPARAVMSELFGKATGVCRGQGGSMHMFSKEHGLLGGFAFIGEGIPVATGAAFSAKYEREVLKNDKADAVTVAFFGDGTCNNGQFFECLNMAALWKLPIIFVVENNLWAIGMSHYRATSVPEIWQKGPAFGMPGVHVDGMDVLKVREVAIEAIARARRGDGPTLVECETYRFRGHSLADPDELRKPAEKAHYAERDPITALKKYMLQKSLVEEAELKSIQKKIDEIVEDAVDFADASPLPQRSQLLENVFADPKGFGIGPDGRYRCEDPEFTAGTAQV